MLVGKKTQLSGTKCNHEFHHACLLQWVEKDNDHCPYCREDLISDGEFVRAARIYFGIMMRKTAADKNNKEVLETNKKKKRVIIPPPIIQHRVALSAVGVDEKEDTNSNDDDINDTTRGVDTMTTSTACQRCPHNPEGLTTEVLALPDACADLSTAHREAFPAVDRV
jgi:hypothetical protein